jgi:hypothetical protein
VMEVVKHKVDRDLSVVIYYASAPVLVLSYLYAMQRRRLVGRFDEENTRIPPTSMCETTPNGPRRIPPFACRGATFRHRVLAAWSIAAAAFDLIIRVVLSYHPASANRGMCTPLTTCTSLWSAPLTERMHTSSCFCCSRTDFAHETQQQTDYWSKYTLRQASCSLITARRGSVSVCV